MACDRHGCGAPRVASPSGGLPMHSLVAKGARVARECVSPLPVEGYWDSRIDPDRCQQIPLQPPEHGRKLGWAYLPPGRLPP